jgi:hypothetical protein
MTTAKYERINGVREEHYGDKDSCSVVAIAIACNVSFGKAQAAMSRAGRKPGNGASLDQMLDAITELGFMANIRYGVGKRPTLSKFVRDTEGAVLAVTKGHVSAIVDGIVHDHLGQRSRKQVYSFIDVVPYVTREETA